MLYPSEMRHALNSWGSSRLLWDLSKCRKDFRNSSICSLLSPLESRVRTCRRTTSNTATVNRHNVINGKRKRMAAQLLARQHNFGWASHCYPCFALCMKGQTYWQPWPMRVPQRASDVVWQKKQTNIIRHVVNFNSKEAISELSRSWLIDKKSP